MMHGHGLSLESNLNAGCRANQIARNANGRACSKSLILSGLAPRLPEQTADELDARREDDACGTEEDNICLQYTVCYSQRDEVLQDARRHYRNYAKVVVHTIS